MLSKVYGVIAFFCLILASGAVESGMYITAFALIVCFGLFTYLSLKEDGTIRKRTKKIAPVEFAAQVLSITTMPVF